MTIHTAIHIHPLALASCPAGPTSPTHLPYLHLQMGLHSCDRNHVSRAMTAVPFFHGSSLQNIARHSTMRMLNA